MNGTALSSIGLFSSDPLSPRCALLERAFSDIGVRAVRVLPWKVRTLGATGAMSLTADGADLTALDAVLVLDLGGHDIGTFFSRVAVLSALQELGVTVINSVRSILWMRNKAECIRRLIAHGVPVPKTLITESIEAAAEFVRENHPAVIKPITGFGGAGVHLIAREFDLENILDYLKFHSFVTGKGAFLLQEYVKSPGFDIRALVVDGEVIATMQRVSTTGFVTNIHAGGIARRNNIDVTDIAIRASRAVRGRFVGVDIIPNQSGDLLVLEVNATPGWAGLQSVTQKDIAAEIAQLFSGTQGLSVHSPRQ